MKSLYEPHDVGTIVTTTLREGTHDTEKLRNLLGRGGIRILRT